MFLWCVRCAAWSSLLRRASAGVASTRTPAPADSDRIQLLGIAAPGEEADAYAVIAEKAVEKGIVAVPGTAFMPGGGKSGFVRTSFSLVSDADADEAMRRLREVILDAQAAVQSRPPPGR